MGMTAVDRPEMVDQGAVEIEEHSGWVHGEGGRIARPGAAGRGKFGSFLFGAPPREAPPLARAIHSPDQLETLSASAQGLSSSNGLSLSTRLDWIASSPSRGPRHGQLGHHRKTRGSWNKGLHGASHRPNLALMD